MARVDLQGVWLLDPEDPAATVHHFRFNGDGAEEVYERQVAHTQYAGRPLPVADFGEAVAQGVTVNIDTESESGDLEALRALVDRQTILLYRDSKGRRIYGTVSAVPVADAWWGASTKLVVTAVDYTPAPVVYVPPVTSA